MVLFDDVEHISTNLPADELKKRDLHEDSDVLLVTTF